MEVERGGQRVLAEVDSPPLRRMIDEAERAWRQDLAEYWGRQHAIVRVAAERLLQSEALRERGIGGIGPEDVVLTEQPDVPDPVEAVLREAHAIDEERRLAAAVQCALTVIDGGAPVEESILSVAEERGLDVPRVGRPVRRTLALRRGGDKGPIGKPGDLSPVPDAWGWT